MYEDGEIDRLVRTIDHRETNDAVIIELMGRFKDQPYGIQNKFITLLAQHLQWFGIRKLKQFFKECSVHPTSPLKKVLEEDETPPFLQIAENVMKKFHIITLKTEQMDRKPIMLCFNNYCYKKDLSKVEIYVSNKIKEMQLRSHRSVYYDVFHYISKQTLFDPELLNYDGLVMIFENGVYDFRKNKFVKASPANPAYKWYYFYELPHLYKNNREYNCPIFKKALVKWIDKKTDNGYREGKRHILISDIFEGIGLCMTMHMGFRSSFLNYGPPRSGKSQFFNIIVHIIGKKNICHTTLQRLGKNEFGAERIEFKILNYVGDLPSSDILDTGLYKSIVGGDISIGGERKGGEQHEIRPTIKFWYNANKVPKIGKWDDEANYDRFIMIPFLNQFEMLDNDTIENFYQHIINDPDEIQGIIHEAIEGFKRLLKRGGFRAILKQDTHHTWNYVSNWYYAFLYDYCEYPTKGRIQVDEFLKYFNELHPGILKGQVTKGLYRFGIEKKKGRIHGTKNEFSHFYYGLKWKDEIIHQRKKEKEESKDEIDVDSLFENEEKNNKTRLDEF